MNNTTAEGAGRGRRLIGWLLFILIMSELASIYLNVEPARYITIACVLILPILGWRQLKIREFYLISICFLLAGAALVWFPSATDWMLEGLTRSAYLASFILLMALLREGALTSPSIVALGEYLTQQPPARRFVAVFSGGHFLSVMINLGSLSLFAPIIQRGVRARLAPGEEVDEIGLIRERRQISAAIRGFSWFLVWAPTAVTQAVMPTLMSGIDALYLISLGLCLVLVMLIVSWVEDTIRWWSFSRSRRESGIALMRQELPFPLVAFRNFATISFLLFGSSVLSSKWADVTIVSGVMLASPIIVVLWIAAQYEAGAQTSSRSKASVNRLNEITFTAMPGYFREAVFISCAGFIGTMGAHLVPVEQLAQVLDIAAAPGWLVLWCLTISVWLFGQLGLSPITMAVFLGSIVAKIPVLPVDITHAALAIAAGTAVCSTGAPFSAGAIMLSRATGYSAFTLTWRWNGTYTIAAIAVLALVYLGLEGV